MPVHPDVDAKLNDLNRRLSFLYEMKKDRELTKARCAFFSGPEMKCAKTKEGGCTCVVADDGYSVPKPKVEEEKTEQD